jgi:hypothetical protein
VAVQLEHISKDASYSGMKKSQKAKKSQKEPKSSISKKARKPEYWKSQKLKETKIQFGQKDRITQ